MNQPALLSSFSKSLSASKKQRDSFNKYREEMLKEEERKKGEGKEKDRKRKGKG